MSEIVEHYGCNQYPSRELVHGMRLSQYFLARDSVLKRIGISFGRRPIVRSTILLNITTLEGRVLADSRIDTSILNNEKFAILDFNLNVRQGTPYVINIYGGGREGEGVWVKWGPTRHGNAERLYMVDVNTNNNEMFCFIVYEETPKVNVVNATVRIVSDDLAIPELRPGETIPEVPKAVITVEAEKPAAVVESEPSPEEVDPKLKIVKGKVSVIIINKNASNVIGTTLNSIYAQTYNHIGVMIVDDASFSKERENLALVVRKYNRQYGIKQVVLKKSKGLSEAANKGALLSDGEFLLFCEPGVVLKPDYLFEAINLLHEKPKSGWVYCDYEKDGKVVKARKFDPKTLKEGYCHLSSMMRVNIFTGFDLNIKKNPETAFFVQMAEQGDKGEWINQTLIKVN